MCVDFRKNYDAEITTQESTEGVPYLGKEPDYSRYHPQHRDVPGCLPLPSYTDIRHQVTVFALFKSVADTRFFTRAIDPVKGGGEDMVDVPNRILRNTTEQFLLYAVGLLTLSTFLDEASLKILPILSCDFVIFRMLFWWGYLNAPLNRAVGMSGTASTTICVYAYCMYCILKPVFISFIG